MRSEEGFTVIEVLVAATILVVGILSAVVALDSARKLTLVAERQTSIAHHAQLELERVKSLPYSQIGLTGTSGAWSTNTSDYTYVSAPGSSCPGAPSGGAPSYQPDHRPGGSTATEPLVIDGCNYTINGTATTFSGGTITPVTAWSDGRFSGNVYDFVTWTSDPTCSQTSTPGAICSTRNDYKRITVVVTLNGVDFPSKPALVSAYVADPNATPPGAPSNSQQNPIDNPSTSCTPSQGQTTTAGSCSNTLIGTTIQYFMSDCSYSQSSCGSPPCSGNNLHRTLVKVLLSPPSPDQLTTTLPAGDCTDTSGNPTPPCFALDLTCGSGTGGVPIVPSGSSSCGTPPVDNTKSHAWVTPQIPAGQTVNLSGKGSTTAYLESTSGVAVNATACIGLYVLPGGVLGSLTGNLLAQPIGVSASASVTASAGVPTPVSFNFNVGSTAAVSSTVSNLARIEVVVWIASAASTNVSLIYDQAQLASQVTLITT